MKATLTLLSAFLIALGVAQSKPLPGKMDEFYFHAANIELLQAKPVQKEIGVTEAQRNRMNDFADIHRGRLSTLEAEYKKAKKNPREVTKDPKLVGFFYELKLNVMRTLQPAQLKRLGEISLQQVGLAALTDEIVAKKVGMSKAQLEKMRAAFKAGGTKYAAAERAAANPVLTKYKDKHVKDKKEAEAMQKQFDADMHAAMQRASPNLTGIRAAAEKSMKAILTSSQLSKYQALLGRKFSPG
ncbi:MAG: hypothetical protein ACAH95_01435 [Fimbriimonas sp.]